MKRLGEILLDRGSIAVAELHTGLEACHHRGGRLGTQLLKFGFVDEHALLDALSEQLEVPFVTASVLRRAPDKLRRMIPRDVARRLQVLVFEEKDGDLSVAMTTPRNPAAIEEVVSYIGLDITPHVATEAGILTALAEIPEEEASTPAPRSPEPGFVDASDEWQRLWTPPRMQSIDLLRSSSRALKGKPPMASTFPGLAPVPDSKRPPAAGPLGDEPYRQLLREVDQRDQVGELVLRRALTVLERCCLLAVHSGKVVGWLATGAGVVLDDVQSFSVPQGAESVLAKANGSEGYWGPIPPGEVNAMIQKVLGDPPPVEIGICPVLVKNRVVAYLLGDAPGRLVSDPDRKGLLEAAQKAGLAFEVLILRKKIVT